jgi:hypothetical protein
LCEHPTPALAISGLDCSSLPTPAAIPGASDLNFQVSGDGRTKPNKLGWAIGEMLPTPTTDDAGNLTRDSGAFQSLTRSIQMLPTPAVNDMGRGKTVEDWDAWTDKMKAAHGNGNGHGKPLEIEAQRLLPTPRALDGTGVRGKTPNRSDEANGRAGLTLSDFASQIGAITDPPSLDGNTSSDDPHQHQLSLDVQGIPA